MRCLSSICSLFIAFFMTSCAEMTVGDVRVHRLLGQPNLDDIRAVSATNPTAEKIYDIQIISGSEMRVYYHPISESPGWATVKRVNGKWLYIEKVAFTS